VDETQESTIEFDRRRVLRRAIAAAAVGTAGVTLLDQGRASANTGSPIVAGQDNTAGRFTSLTCSDTNSALYVVGQGSSNLSYTAAVLGDTNAYNGVAGITSSVGNVGVFGVSHAMDTWGQRPAGVAGHSDVNPGVVGQSTSSHGLSGFSNSGCGVKGQSNYIGVSGYSQGGVAVAGVSSSGYAVEGIVDGPGTGVYAEGSGGGTALRVNGVAKFSRSGVATITAGHAKVVVPHVTLSAGSTVLATLQHLAPGNAVSSAVPNASSSTITISLLKNATTTFKVAWFVLG